MSNWRCLVVCGCTALLLGSCQPSLKKVIKQVNKSTVLIYYQGKPGHGTGLFVEQNQEGCNILTARHVVPLNTKIKLKTSDEKIL